MKNKKDARVLQVNDYSGKRCPFSCIAGCGEIRLLILEIVVRQISNIDANCAATAGEPVEYRQVGC